MKKLLIFLFLTLVSCKSFNGSEHSIVVTNRSSYPVFFESSYALLDTSLFIDSNRTGFVFHRTDAHVIPEEFHSEHVFKLFAIQDQDTIESSVDINLLELQYTYSFDPPYYHYGYRLVVKDSLF